MAQRPSSGRGRFDCPVSGVPPGSSQGTRPAGDSSNGHGVSRHERRRRDRKSRLMVRSAGRLLLSAGSRRRAHCTSSRVREAWRTAECTRGCGAATGLTERAGSGFVSTTPVSLRSRHRGHSSSGSLVGMGQTVQALFVSPTRGNVNERPIDPRVWTTGSGADWAQGQQVCDPVTEP
jgi:hypothetical protein